MKNKNGFTLVEMSIVLIVIGLIVAGIMGGKALIHGAELNSVIAEINGFKAAINLYRDKYDAIPGDHLTAQDYWPTQCVDSGANTCNGNGNGFINHSAALYENLRAWQHLVLAQFIAGSYSGTAPEVVGVSKPPSKIKGGGYDFFYSSVLPTYSKNTNAVTFGKLPSEGVRNAILSPPDTESIDKKSDDGKPDTGYLRAMSGDDITSNFCVTGAPLVYNVSVTGVACVLFFYSD